MYRRGGFGDPPEPAARLIPWAPSGPLDLPLDGDAQQQAKVGGSPSEGSFLFNNRRKRGRGSVLRCSVRSDGLHLISVLASVVALGDWRLLDALLESTTVRTVRDANRSFMGTSQYRGPPSIAVSFPSVSGATRVEAIAIRLETITTSSKDATN